MNRIRKWWKPLLAAVVTAMSLQLSVSLLVRTTRVRVFLTRQLERSFGRPVEVRAFSVDLFPAPQVDAYAVSVGEDPDFGNEYFLRADKLSAALRWGGLIRGRFELGTLKLDRPSLILVRATGGKWNLEQWLPAARPDPGIGARRPPTNRLQKIEVNDGRVNFKIGENKISFAFEQVEGSVEQTSNGRWRLDLQAEPWRSGVPLQLAGLVRVTGEVAGTSTRLRPAHLRISWSKSSLADVFRLVRGSDLGVRGSFAGEATADSDEASLPESKDAVLGDWRLTLQARAAGIHRWNLAEREDNPQLGLRVNGRWNPTAGSIRVRDLVIETPRSNFRGSGSLRSTDQGQFEFSIDSSGVQAADFLDWLHAFKTDVADGIAASQYFTGTAKLSGWPLSLDEAAFSSLGGKWSVPGFGSALNVRPLRGGMRRSKLIIEPFSVSLPARRESAANKAVLENNKDFAENVAAGVVNFSVQADLQQRSGQVRAEGQLPQAESLLSLASLFGYEVRHGWDLTGRTAGDLRWQWNVSGTSGWAGHADLTRAYLRVAGLNQPIQLDSARAEWAGGIRRFTLNKASAFGATWSGTMEQASGLNHEAGTDASGPWTFQLQADRLDAAELDRWVGPRARPTWLQRLLPAALGGSTQPPASAAVLKKIHAEGDLRAGEVAVDKVMLKAFRAHAALDDLHLTLENAQAQWCGGSAQGRLQATLTANPVYDVSATFEQVSLPQTPWLAQVASHLAGTASGKIELKTSGIGRETLLKTLSGKGELRLIKVELRGWDLAGTMAQGVWQAGVSRWPTGAGTFHISDGGFELNALRLASPSEEFLLKGSVSFSQDADLTAESHSLGRAVRTENTVRFLTISGPLKEPKVSLEKTEAQQPGD